MTKTTAIILLSLVVACTGTSTGNPPTQSEADYSITTLELMSFRVESAGTAQCENEYEEGESKLVPSFAEIETSLGQDADEFVILMKEEVSQEEYPLGQGNRDDLEDDPDYVARANRIAESQLCAIDDVLGAGGTYEQSFVLINAFVAQLTSEQAVDIAARTDVKSVELSDTGAPPP